MKKIILTLFVVSAILAVSGIGQAAIERNSAVVQASGVTVKVPNIAIEKARAFGIQPGTFEKTIFINNARENNGKTSKGQACYKLMGVKWGKLPQSYVVHPDVDSKAPGAVQASANSWDNATSKLLFNGYEIDQTADWDNDVPDGRNEYSLGNYPQSGVIAVTIIWTGIPLGQRNRQIVEYDVMFDTNFVWGDAVSNPAVMDLQNIATHETGHGLGLNDIYTSACSEVSMYGYASYGETKKITLEQSDIAGLQKMYGM